MRDPTQPMDGAGMDGESNPYAPKASTRRDVLHDRQLLRDLETINARVLRELGPLPAEGLPMVARRKPVLPRAPLPPAHSATREDDAMTLNPILVAASLALTACAPAYESSAPAGTNGATDVQEIDSPSMRQKFRANPDPKRRYDITMTIEDAPGLFKDVGFSAHYDAPDCLYWTDKAAGTTSRPTHMIRLPHKKLDDTTYGVTVYLDAMLDEDYYGDGVCHWQLSSVSSGVKATGADAETGFGADISPEAIMAQQAETTYLWSEYYPRARIDNFREYGSKTLDDVPLARRDEFFTITLKSSEVKL